jgi:hypothetical protein
MSLLKIISATAALIAVSTAAFGFQEQGGPAPAAVAPATPQRQLDLSAPPVEAGKTGGGAEVRIPGLGRLGNLPKMDFGLELLYGAAEQKSPDAQPREETREDLTIRGTVKHKW